MSPSSFIDRQLVAGLVFLALLAAVVGGVVALYRGDFADTVPITVEAGRAGLTMDAGSPVKVRGVEVGTVSAVRTRGDSVVIEADIDRDRIGDIPAGVTAQLVPPTAFGAKYVQLTPPADVTGAGSLRAGSVITADRVTVEVNQAFSNLTKVLDAARPSEVNSALTAVAGAVDGRGEAIGSTIESLDGYLGDLDPFLATLVGDVRTSVPVLDTYQRATSDLLATARHASTTASTLDQRQTSLRSLLTGLHDTADSTDALLKDSRADLHRTLSLSDPIIGVLAGYAPELTCLVPGLVRVNELGEKAVGGGLFPGVTTFTRVQHEDTPYRAPTNLPQIGDNGGPGCYGLPVVSASEARQPFRNFDTGANPAQPGTEDPVNTTSNTLFGVLAGLVNFG
jgi:phospholipid/cholesterol/gamma-HCH transport system substrate-binding protein